MTRADTERSRSPATSAAGIGLTRGGGADMGVAVRHAVLGVGLALGASACKDEAATTPAAAPAAEAAAATPDDHRETAAEAGDPAKGGPEEGDPAKGDPAKDPGRRGLADLTREVIDQARTTANEPMRLVPDAATFAMQVQLPAVLAHPEAQFLWQKAEDSEAQFKQAMDVVRACLGRLEAIDEVVVGFDLDDHLILVARGKGLGTDATWRCFERETSSRGDSLDLEITGIPRGEGPQLRESDKSPAEADRGYFPDDDTFVMLSHEWDADVQALLGGETKPAIEARLAPPTTRAKPDSTFWMVGRWEDTAASALPETIRGIDDMALSLNIEDGALVVEVSTDAGEAADATRVRERLQKEFDEIKGMLGMFGLPGTVAPKIVFEGEGDLVTLAFTLTQSELEGLRAGIERTL